jgi:hypothetical protein
MHRPDQRWHRQALVSSLDKIDQVVADSHPSPVLPPPGWLPLFASIIFGPSNA